MTKEYYSTMEVAKILKVSRIAVFKWAQEGKMKAIKVGKNYIIPHSALSEKLGTTIGTEKKKAIDMAINRAIKDYGQAFKMLGKE